MRGLLVFFAILAVAAASRRPGLRIRFDANPLGFGSDSFMPMPQTVREAISEDYYAVPTPAIHLPRLVMYCHPTTTVCLFYDDTSYIAGVQVAVDPSKVETIYDWDMQGWSTWEHNGTTYRTLHVFFVSEEFLSKSQQERIATRDSDKLLQDGAVWVQGNNKIFTKILADNKEEIKNTNFTRQGCIPLMGTHFFYNMSSDLVCQDDTMFPWFQLMDSDQLIGVGSVMVGSLEVDSRRDWFERPPVLAVRAIVPHRPQCLLDIASNPGITTMHIYFIDQPWLVGCSIF